jgi:hypothetical protein
VVTSKLRFSYNKEPQTKIVEEIPESQLCEEDEMIHFEEEPSIENDITLGFAL